MQDRYKTYLLTKKKVKPNTVTCYLGDIDLLEKKLEELGVDGFENLTQDDFDTVVADLEHAGRSNASVQRFISSVKNFYTFLVYDGVCTKNVLLGYCFSRDREDERRQILLSELEVSRLLSQPDTATFKGIRDRAMLELSYASALRVSDLLELNIADVNVFTGTVTCRCGKTVKYISLYPSAAAILGEYISAYTRMHGMIPPNSPLFINQQFKRLTRQGLWKIIKDYSKDAGINKDITPLTLRQSYASHLAQKGATAQDLMRILDYQNIASARVYIEK